MRCVKDVFEAIEDLELKWEYLSSVTTDGAENMTSLDEGFIGQLYKYLVKKNIPKPLQFHCVIHQQSLCGKFLSSNEVMSSYINSQLYT